MPPPMTPASLLVNSTQTPSASALNLQVSVTPLESPSRARGERPTRTKRAHESDAADTDEMPRAKRVQTQFILDAGGLSSSPVPSGHG